MSTKIKKLITFNFLCVVAVLFIFLFFCIVNLSRKIFLFISFTNFLVFLLVYTYIYIYMNTLRIFRSTVCKTLYVCRYCLHIRCTEAVQFNRNKFAIKLFSVYSCRFWYNFLYLHLVLACVWYSFLSLNHIEINLLKIFFNLTQYKI